MEEVEAAAKAANASDFILTLPQAGIAQKLDHCFDSFFEIQKGVSRGRERRSNNGIYVYMHFILYGPYGCINCIIVCH